MDSKQEYIYQSTAGYGLKLPDDFKQSTTEQGGWFVNEQGESVFTLTSSTIAYPDGSLVNAPYVGPTGKPKRNKLKCKISKQSRKRNRK